MRIHTTSILVFWLAVPLHSLFFRPWEPQQQLWPEEQRKGTEPRDKEGWTRVEHRPYVYIHAFNKGQSFLPILFISEIQNEVSFAVRLILTLSWRRDMFLSLPPADKTCIKVVGEWIAIFQFRRLLVSARVLVKQIPCETRDKVQHTCVLNRKCFMCYM